MLSGASPSKKIFVSDSQRANTLADMFFTDLGIVIPVSFVSREKARGSTVSKPSGNTTSSRAGQSDIAL